MKKFYSSLLLILLSILPMTLSAKSVNIPVFGKISVEKTDSGYVVEHDKLGSITATGTCEGTICDLNARVDAAKVLQKIPGYEMLSPFKLGKIDLYIHTTNGLGFKTKIRPKGKFKKLFNFLKIKNPYIEFGGRIAVTGLELKSSLNLEKTIWFSKKAGIGYRYKKLEFLINLGLSTGNDEGGTSGKVAIEPLIKIKSVMEFKPSKYDEWVYFSPDISYNFISQSIAFSGTLKNWKNVFRLKKHLKKSINIPEAAVQIEINPANPLLIAGFGIAATDVNIFDNRFTCLFSVDVDSGSFVLQAEKKSLTLNDLKDMIAGGVGSFIPDVFPDSFGLRNIKLLIAPTGGQVGEIKVDPGFEISGEWFINGVGNGSIEIYADLKRGVKFAGDLDLRELKKTVNKKLSKIPIIKPIINEIFKTFYLNYFGFSFQVSARAKVSATLDLDMTLFRKNFKFTLDSGDLKNIVTTIANKIVDVAREKVLAAFIAVGEKIAETATTLYSSVRNGFEKVGKSVGDFFKNTIKKIRLATSHEYRWKKANELITKTCALTKMQHIINIQNFLIASKKNIESIEELEDRKLVLAQPLYHFIMELIDNWRKIDTEKVKEFFRKNKDDNDDKRIAQKKFRKKLQAAADSAIIETFKMFKKLKIGFNTFAELHVYVKKLEGEQKSKTTALNQKNVAKKNIVKRSKKQIISSFKKNARKHFYKKSLFKNIKKWKKIRSYRRRLKKRKYDTLKSQIQKILMKNKKINS